MKTPKNGQLRSRRFVYMCVANWFLHLYVFAMWPLLLAMVHANALPLSTLAWAAIAFAVGMILPGPFVAQWLERRSRKSVLLKAVLWMSIPPTCMLLFWHHAAALVAAHALQGLSFGIAQSTLGTTLVNDILLSRERTRGDVHYAWAGRLGIPAGLCAGCVALLHLPVQEALQWSLVLALLAFLCIGNVNVPLKAPVKMPRFTLDRFFLPSSYPLMLTMFVGPWLLGRMVGLHLTMPMMACMTAGAVVAYVLQRFTRYLWPQRWHMLVAYVLLLVAVALHRASTPWADEVAALLIGIGTSMLSARHLLDWLVRSAHCQRGTAQNTYMLAWRVAFAAGVSCSLLVASHIGVADALLCLCGAVGYLMWRRHPAACCKPRQR